MSATARLSTTQVAILQHAADGMSDAQIGKAMNLSTGTCKKYMLFIRAVLGADNRTHAVAIAFRQGLVK